MRFAFAALALLPSVALGAINIVGPSASSFWVQNTSNVITWTFTAGDPSPVDILVVNSDNTTLNGPFSIAQFVDLSIMSFTVTNVTLRAGSNYEVEFVNTHNHSQVYATSNTFDVKPAGTAPAPAASGSVNNGTSSASGGASGSGSGSAPSPTVTHPMPSGTASSAPRNFGTTSITGIFSVMAACGVASLAVLL